MSTLILSEVGWTPVRSSNLHRVRYHPFSGRLEIQFRSGRIYEYFDVPGRIHEGLMNAQSHGKFFHTFIRYAYGFRRLQ